MIGCSFPQERRTTHRGSNNTSAFLADGCCTFTTSALDFYESCLRKSVCHSTFTQFYNTWKNDKIFYHAIFKGNHKSLGKCTFYQTKSMCKMQHLIYHIENKEMHKI